MKLNTLFKRLVDMSYPEQLNLLEGIRTRRMIEKPAVQQRKRKTEARTSKGNVNKTKKLFANLNEVDKAAMIALLKEGV